MSNKPNRRKYRRTGGVITDPAELDRRMQQYLRDVEDRIDRFGYTCQGVFPTDDGDLTYYFAYTIGRQPDRAEVIITGAMDQDVLDLAVRRMDEGAELGKVMVANDDGYLMVFAPVPDEAVGEHLVMARRRNDGIHVMAGAPPAPLVAWQLVWQDDRHRWPWEVATFAAQAPVLAGPDWRPSDG